MRVLVLVLAGLAAAKEKDKHLGHLQGIGKMIFQNKASTQRNRALKHLAKLDKEVQLMKGERARDRKIRKQEYLAAADADEDADEKEGRGSAEDARRRRLTATGLSNFFSASSRRKRALDHLQRMEHTSKKEHEAIQQEEFHNSVFDKSPAKNSTGSRRLRRGRA